MRGIKKTKIRLECVLKHVTDLSGSNRGCHLIIGEVVYLHIDESVYIEGSINIDALAPVSRLDGANYATIGDIFTIERPK